MEYNQFDTGVSAVSYRPAGQFETTVDNNSFGPVSVPGRELPVVADMGIGGCIDAFVADDRLYVVGNGITRIADHIDMKVSMSGTLYIFDIKSPAEPQLLGTLGSLGNVRQLEVHDGAAYVVSREDGLFIIDISNPAAPCLLSRFDAVEFCTGVDVSGGLAFLSCRHTGVQIVDVSDRGNPRHVSMLKTGEAQSVDVRGGYLYAGIWGAKEIAVGDVRDPCNPKIVARVPIDGRGDGVFIKGHYLYAATGHHARGLNEFNMSDPAFGRGNGMEVFDISDPAAPRFVSRVKLNRFVNMFYDMWDVTVIGDYAFLSHTYNGVFVINVSDPKYPVLTAHATLPQIDGQVYSSPVGGIAMTDNVIYAAGILSDLHVIAAPELAGKLDAETRTTTTVKPREHALQIESAFSALPEFAHYRPQGQVYATVLTDQYIYAACGMAGIHVLKADASLGKMAEYPTQGFAMDVKRYGDYLYVAEGYGGLSVWRINEYALTLCGRYKVDGYTIRQAVIPGQGRYAVLQVGSKWMHIVSIEKPEKPELVFWDTHFQGQLFHRQLSYGLAEDRYVACSWHSVGIFWYDLFGGSIPRYAGFSNMKSFLAFNGIVCTPGHVIMTHDKGYVMPDIKEGAELAPLPHYGVEGHDLTGKPTVFGDTMFISNRLNGQISVVDISD
ncbi:MAG: hypothetical protein LBV27_04055, partial [Oscillospiraceae bacterium]|nr:hypothetical protein [Oscillospiraceae bacterium]